MSKIPITCEGCGAVMRGSVCEYCGRDYGLNEKETHYYDCGFVISVSPKQNPFKAHLVKERERLIEEAKKCDDISRLRSICRALNGIEDVLK